MQQMQSKPIKEYEKWRYQLEIGQWYDDVSIIVVDTHTLEGKFPKEITSFGSIKIEEAMKYVVSLNNKEDE